MCDNNNQNALDIMLNVSDVRQVFVKKKRNLWVPIVIIMHGGKNVFV